jgi:hypothetical protein
MAKSIPLLIYVIKVHVHLCAFPMSATTGQLLILILIPLFAVLWIWVSAFRFECVRKRGINLWFSPQLDDRFKTRHCVLHLSNILQLPRNGVFR